ncbi:uncharacterized protein LOC141899597 [Tubulanus polymorphus]|uniref:uncharacterized protein LOC141899597 n=1 Tax=Tubulanus polymorphus TaxID=672921 RepID=UPI003DA1F67F
MVITKRHENVLQYKESYCYPNKGGKICDNIRGNALLHTLIREKAKPIPCIFEGSYIFSYINGSAVCKSPFSTIDECASNTQYKFHFRHCPGIPGSNNIDYDFKCLARWDGGGKFLVGVFRNPNYYEDFYRCFLYEMNQLGRMELAMSADASCMGLVNIEDGPVSMQLTKNIQEYPTTVCTFPQWLTDSHNRWHDLSARHIYHVEKSRNTIHVYYKNHHKAEKIATDILRCHRLDRLTTTKKLFQAVSFTTSGCQSKYQCVRLLRRKENVVDIVRGKLVETENDACNEDNFNNEEKQLLIPTKLTSTKCPFGGQYGITTSTVPRCKIILRSGCADVDRLQLSSCPDNKEIAASLTCLSSWTQNTTTYVIARKTTGSKAANCFSFKTVDARNMRFSVDNACNMGAPAIVDRKMSYTIQRSAGPCSLDTAGSDDRGSKIIGGHRSAGKITADHNNCIKPTASMASNCCVLLLLTLVVFFT